MPAPPDPTLACQPESWGLTWPTAAQSSALLQQLAVQGQVLRQALAGTQAPSPWGRDAYSGSPAGLPQCPPAAPGQARGPGGVVLHFTAGPSLGSAVRWFCDPAQKSDRSAHLVVARGREEALLKGPWTAACQDALALPATAVECRPPQAGAVAGAWSNGAFYHIELVGWGCDRADGFPRDTTLVWGRLANINWQPYTARQLAAAAQVIRCLRASLGDFSAQQVWGHEHVQTVATPGSLGTNKLDTGPLLPWPALRRAVARPGEVLPAPSDSLLDQLLEGLGYGVGRGVGQGLRLAQFSLGLQPDGQPGPKTQAALAARAGERTGLGPLTWAQAARALPALADHATTALRSLVVA